MLLVPKYSGSQLGYSFYLCLSSGCIVLLLTILLCCCVCRAAAKGDGDSGTNSGAVQSYGGAGSTVPYSPGGHAVMGQAAVIEQRAIVHDPESGGVFMIMRRINLTRIVTSTIRN